MKLTQTERNMIINALEQRAFNLQSLGLRHNDRGLLDEAFSCKSIVRAIDAGEELL
jgi:hypothetical protein